MPPAPLIGARELLRLDALGERGFRAAHNLDNGRGTIFGGQPMVQGLAAAARTVAGWPAHSLTGYFLRAGAVGRPVDYAVEAMRDGRRFASRRVLASQEGKPIYDMLCAFHDPEEGPRHQHGEPPPSPPPESLQTASSFARANADRFPAALIEAYGRPFPIELRLIDPEAMFFARRAEPVRSYWLRMPSAAGVASPLDQQCLLAFLSDFWLAAAAGAPHFRPEEAGHVATVTLNHSLWFHAPVCADAWLLYHTESPWAGEGRGLVHGSLYDEDGRLVATTAQEISIRRM